MKNKLEEQMMEVMDGASLKDLMPDFDKEALWNTVATQLPEQQKKKVFSLGWVARIAAVLLIVIAAWTVIHFSGINNNDAEVAVTKPSSPINKMKQENTAPVQEQRIDQQPAVNIAQTTHNVTPSKALPTQGITIQNPTLPKVVNDPNLLIPVREQSVAVAVPKKVTHYLDIEDEVPMSKPSEAVANAPFIQMKLNKPGGTVESIQKEKPFKEFVFALSK